MWKVYMLRCADKTLYTGVTTDIARRVIEHNESKLGAKYTRARRPVVCVYFCDYETRSDACKAESAMKKLSRVEKLALITDFEKKKKKIKKKENK